MLPHSVATFSLLLAKHLKAAIGCHRLPYLLTGLTLWSTLALELIVYQADLASALPPHPHKYWDGRHKLCAWLYLI